MMNTQPNNKLANVIRKRFEQTGWSIKKLADLSGVPYQAAHGFVRGTRDPVCSTIDKLCKVLGLELRPVQRDRKTKG